MRYINLSKWIAVKIQTDPSIRFEDIRANVVPINPNQNPDNLAAKFAEAKDVYQVRWNWSDVTGGPPGGGQGHYIPGPMQLQRFRATTE